MILNKVKKIYKILIVEFFSNSSSRLKNDWSVERTEEFQILKDFVIKVENKYEPEVIKIENSEKKHKWVGAQILDETIFTVPNDEIRILKLHNNAIEYLENVKEGVFKWTGGCIWNNALYCFPRSSNSFLKIKDGRIKEIPLSRKYNIEHHYSGVCTNQGIVYQPPRNTNHILKTDLSTGESSIIEIIDKRYKVVFRYCGSIIHPNGYIYFFPEKMNKVIKLDPKTDKWCFIGKRISTMCFDAKIGMDGNIYGYSAYSKGIMKIDVIHDSVEMIHREVVPGAYGTKYGIDGCLYSVPGDGNRIYQYNVLEDKVNVICDLNNDNKAKYAGGVTTKEGTIVCVPATEKTILLLKNSKKLKIPEKIYNFFYLDNY